MRAIDRSSSAEAMFTGRTNGGISHGVFDWGVRILVLLSLAAHIFLAVFASFRRRQRSGVATLLLWSAYLFTDWAAPYAIGKLPFGSTLREQQLVALWVPFLLSHLGGPDNITAFSFEDNKLSLRKAASTLLHILGTISSLYKQANISVGNRALLCASFVMVAMGFAKYIEKAWALRSADFNNIRKTAKKNPISSIRIQPHPHGKKLSDEQALLVAHSLLDITKGAFADYSVSKIPFRSNTDLRKVFFQGENNTGWVNMCKVVEMELSLMYDILYTKAAAKIQTSMISYFIIRIISPVATLTMAMLFWFSSKAGERREDVIITYILLVVTLLLEVRWLLRATASTWTYAFFNNAQGASWLQHEVLCTGRWHRLRRVILSLDPLQLLHRKPRGSYRLWTGTIGKYNLFDDCTRGKAKDIRSKLLELVIRSEDTRTEYMYSSGYKLGELGIHGSVRELLFEQIMKALGKAYSRDEIWVTSSSPAPQYPTAAPDSGNSFSATHQSRHPLDVALGFVPEFQELILILHVATDICFIKMSSQNLCIKDKLYRDAIEVTSNYMAFLAAARPEMLPGLNLRSMFNDTRKKLSDICQLESGRISSKNGLAETLLNMEERRRTRSMYFKGEGDDQSFVLSEGITIGEVLTLAMEGKEMDFFPHGDNYEDFRRWKRILFLIQLLIPDLKDGIKGPYPICKLLELILESWVRLLINVSTRCARDSHAKQLGRGCELTTIVWILSHHASMFGI